LAEVSRLASQIGSRVVAPQTVEAYGGGGTSKAFMLGAGLIVLVGGIGVSLLLSATNQRDDELPATPVSVAAAAPVQTLVRTVAPAPVHSSTAPPPAAPTSGQSQPITREPRLVSKVFAEYPEEASNIGIEGAVDLTYSIGKDGNVSDVEVVNYQPSDIFNRAAVSAVRQWKYEPMLVSGAPVESRSQIRLQFRLDQSVPQDVALPPAQ
jgi:protein TonB